MGKSDLGNIYYHTLYIVVGEKSIARTLPEKLLKSRIHLQVLPSLMELGS